ncbi:MAG: hypothetical protein V1791_14375 [Pseudomonadota bacterium]
MTSMLVRKRNLNSGDEKGAGYFIEKLPAPFFFSETIFDLRQIYSKTDSPPQPVCQITVCPANSPPFIAIPDNTFTVGQSLLMSLSLRPRPLVLPWRGCAALSCETEKWHTVKDNAYGGIGFFIFLSPLIILLDKLKRLFQTAD